MTTTKYWPSATRIAWPPLLWVSARHGLCWWEVDTTYLAIRLLSAIGLAQHVTVPNWKARRDKPGASR